MGVAAVIAGWMHFYDSGEIKGVKLNESVKPSQNTTSSHVYPRRVFSGVRSTDAPLPRPNARMFEAVLEEHAAKQARLKEDAGTSPHRA